MTSAKITTSEIIYSEFCCCLLEVQNLKIDILRRDESLFPEGFEPEAKQWCETLTATWASVQRSKLTKWALNVDFNSQLRLGRCRRSLVPVRTSLGRRQPSQPSCQRPSDQRFHSVINWTVLYRTKLLVYSLNSSQIVHSEEYRQPSL